MNPNYANQVKERINKLHRVGFIHPVDKVTRLSPILVVPKKNDKIKICVDYKKLNATTIFDSFLVCLCDSDRQKEHSVNEASTPL